MSGRKRLGKGRKIRVKTWQLVVLLLPLLFVDATLLRLDHIRMTELRDAVLQADAENNDEAVEQALVRLKEFVFSHIVVNMVEENGVQRVSFGTGPFYLEHQYLRAATAALEAAKNDASSDNNPNGNIYAAASEVCQPQAIENGWAWNNPNYINCMMGEINKYPAASELSDKIIANLPSTELYRREYASPVWAPTIAGFMILITLVIIVVILVRGIIWLVVRIAVRFV